MRYICIILFCFIWSNPVFAQQESTVFDNAEFSVEPLYSVNTVASEISPVFVHNFVFFTGVPDKYFDKLDKKKSTPFYSVFSAITDSNGIVTTTRRLVLGFGADFHEGPADYCEKTGELFVTMSDVNQPESNNNYSSNNRICLRIVIMKFFGGRWQIVEELPFSDERFNFAHPAINATGDTLIFSSDLNSPVNYGNLDIFMSVKKDTSWSNPINLGNNINTAGKEMFPTFIKGGLLSFASDGRMDKLGGLDIYYTTFPDSGEIKTFNRPINTEFDDFGLVVHESGDVGYFASNRNTGRSDDIFTLEIDKLFEIVDGKVLNQLTNKPVQNASLIFNNCDGEYLKQTLTDNFGNFSVELPDNNCLQIEISKDGYKNMSQTVTNTNHLQFLLEQKNYYEILTLDPDNLTPVEEVSVSCKKTLLTNSEGLVTFELPLPDSSILMIKKDGYLNLSVEPDTTFSKVVTRDTIFMYKKVQDKSYIISSNYNKWSILRDLQTELNNLINIMKLNPDIMVEIGFHTDSKGLDSYNEWLSQKNAEIAGNYIIQNGIEQNRIVAVGYGEKQILNHCKNGVDCTEEEHAVNRRVEIKILEINPL